MAGEKDRTTRLQKLSDSDFEIADGQPDIRGWEVKDDSGRHIGEVDELIFDYQSRKVRYLVLDLEDNELDLDDREVLVPIGIAELHESDDDVILTGVTAEQLQQLPEYEEDRFDTDQELSTRTVFGGLGGAVLPGTTAANSGDDFYNHDHFNEDNLYRKRQQRTMTGDDSNTARPVKKEEHYVRDGEVETGNIRLQSRLAEQQASSDLGSTQQPMQDDRSSQMLDANEADLRQAAGSDRLDKDDLMQNTGARGVQEDSFAGEMDDQRTRNRDLSDDEDGSAYGSRKDRKDDESNPY